VHISALSHKFVDDPRKVVNPGDQVTVKVLKVDTDKNQISLSMLLDAAPERAARPPAGASQEAGSNGSGGRGRARGPRRSEEPRKPMVGGDPSSRPGGPAPAAARAGGRSGGGGRDRDERGGGSRPGQGGGPRGGGTPFNNPFAALMGTGASSQKPARK
jgi:uncharacterized protein